MKSDSVYLQRRFILSSKGIKSVLSLNLNLNLAKESDELVPLCLKNYV